jgi:hypothetical protein
MPKEQHHATDPPVSQASPPAEGTPVVVPHIDFNKPTGNPLVEVRKGYGLTPLDTRERSPEPPTRDG